MHTQDPDLLASALADTPITTEFDHLDVEHIERPAGRLDALRAFERLARYAAAGTVRAFAGLHAQAARETGTARGATEAEVCAASALPPATVHTKMAEAATLVHRFPETLDLLSRGEVSYEQAAALVKITATLGDEQARAVQARVLTLMPGQALALTRQAIRRAVATVDPNGAAARHAKRVKHARVEVRPEDDGMATLSLYTRAETARAILTRIDHLTRTRVRGDLRSRDQRRADTLAALIINQDESKNASQGSVIPPAAVHVIVNIETLRGTADAPGHLEGHGPITAAQARALAAGPHAVLRRLIVTPAGKLVHVDPDTHRLPAAERRFITARDRTCDFPHCQMPARLCDLDHEIPFATGGPSGRRNQCPRCRRHHYLKTFGHWRTGHRDDTAIWTSRATGRSYTSNPEPYPVVTEDDLIQPDDE